MKPQNLLYKNRSCNCIKTRLSRGVSPRRPRSNVLSNMSWRICRWHGAVKFHTSSWILQRFPIAHNILTQFLQPCVSGLESFLTNPPLFRSWISKLTEWNLSTLATCCACTVCYVCVRSRSGTPGRSVGKFNDINNTSTAFLISHYRVSLITICFFVLYKQNNASRLN